MAVGLCAGVGIVVRGLSRDQQQGGIVVKVGIAKLVYRIEQAGFQFER